MALAKEESISKLIVNFSANSQKVAKAKQTRGYFLGRRKLLEDYWIKFNNAHDAISLIEVNDDNTEELKKVLSDERFAKIESAYCEALGELNDLIDEPSTFAHDTTNMSHSTPTGSVVSGGSNVKSILPKLQLPTFDGSFDEWLNFKDMFTTCVINDTLLSNVQRLHYLNCSLRGDATSVIKNIQINDDNFNTAWDILQGRYDNKRKLIKQYLRNIVKLPTMNKESSEALRWVLDGITEAIRALKQLGRPTEKWDDWLILHVTEKLDPVMIKDWETSLNAPNAIPTYAELETFLVNQLQGLDAMAACSQTNQNEVIQKPIKIHPIHSHQTNVNRCPSCSGKHVLMFCSDFRKQNPAVQQLRLRRTRLLVPVTGVGGSSVGKSTGVVDISVSSLTEPNINISCKALILPRLGQLMPTLRIDTEPFCEFMDLDLADPNFHEPGSIDVILGADIYGSILHGEIMQTAVGASVAQRTHLGWVIYGRLPESITRELSTSYCAFSQIELANLVQCMWKFTENEDVESISKMTQDELYCEEFFKKTVQRTSSGRYVVKYPFKDSIDLTTLPKSRGDAFKLFYYQLRRLDNNTSMKTMYQKFMSEYQLLGHMEPVFVDVSPQNLCYIPHHGVYKESSSTTKLRVVFNAARKYNSGNSLNDCLHVGPKLQSDLSAIILQWRTHRIAFMADIEKCYRQILVQRDDANMQRIIWTDNEGLPTVYRLLTVTWVFSSPDASTYQLHLFSDASTSAYAAVTYLRVKTVNGEIKVSISIAKTKVAPLKKITVPCLELNGALLASKLVLKVLATLKLTSITTFCWSDSKTVLSWIRSNPGKHKQYVANRITKIQELTDIDGWRYVPTDSNPADVASRGVYPSQLGNLNIWWSGPEWLRKAENEWPQQICDVKNEPVITSLLVQTPFKLTEELGPLGLLSMYSNINTLVGVTSWCYRYIDIKLKRPHETASWCTTTERRRALKFWIRYVQKVHFANEVSCLSQGKPISSKSKLLKLNPTIDESGIIRLNGRLKNAWLPVSERFPIILPKENKLTKMLIDQGHSCTMHGGKQATLNFLRRRYWLIDGRAAVKKFISHCLTCFRQNPHVTTQIMGSLPTPRCKAAAPFKHSGLDYAGPYAIRATKGRGHRSYKGWVALFVCLSTRAIHLELVSDMTTDTFLSALRRFFSTRGYSSSIYSDCATTFAGANIALKEDFAACRKQLEEGARSFSCHGVTWHFIPPGSPNFGGIWEAGIKSMKHHLKRAIGEATLTFEEFYTVLKQIEAVLNSRPLSALSDDPSDLVALTPGHFLVGGPITSAPEPDLLNVKSGRLTRWKQLQQMQQDFWKRWSCEYLHELQIRSKWNQAKPNIKVGDLVLIRDERTPPTQWQLGRVLEVHSGDDDLVRVATIRTQSSILKRAISKLVVLPIDNNCTDEHGGRPEVSSQ